MGSGVGHAAHPTGSTRSAASPGRHLSRQFLLRRCDLPSHRLQPVGRSQRGHRARRPRLCGAPAPGVERPRYATTHAKVTATLLMTP